MARKLTERLRRAAIEEGGPVTSLLEGTYEGELETALSPAEAKDAVGAAIRRLGGLPLSEPGLPDALTTTIGSGFLHFVDTKLIFFVVDRAEGSVFRVRAEAKHGFFRQRAAVMAVERALDGLGSVAKERASKERD